MDKNVTYIGYCRVSKSDMTLDSQIDKLLAAGVPKRNIYQEKITGTKRDREELNRMIEELEPETVAIVAEISRLSRSTRDLTEIVELIHSKGADVKSLRKQ